MRDVFFDPNGALFRPYDDDLQSNSEDVAIPPQPTCFNPDVRPTEPVSTHVPKRLIPDLRPPMPPRQTFR